MSRWFRTQKSCARCWIAAVVSVPTSSLEAAFRKGGAVTRPRALNSCVDADAGLPEDDAGEHDHQELERAQRSLARHRHLDIARHGPILFAVRREPKPPEYTGSRKGRQRSRRRPAGMRLAERSRASLQSSPRAAKILRRRSGPERIRKWNERGQSASEHPGLSVVPGRSGTDGRTSEVRDMRRGLLDPRRHSEHARGTGRPLLPPVQGAAGKART